MPARRRFLLVPNVVVFDALVVSGCALPPMVAIASYAATGLSYPSSGKSLSDHALSAIVEMGCAVLRVVMGGDICREQGEPPDDGIVLASADGRKPWDIEPASGSNENVQDIRDGTGDYFDGATTSQGPMLARADIEALKGVILDGLAFGTEFFALMRDDGALKIFAHDPAQRDSPENMRMVLKVDGYAHNTLSVEGVRVNGRYYAISDILV